MGNSLHLQISHVTRQFKVNGEILTALDDVSLDIAEGEFVTIVEASGCGKSTLLRLGAGLDLPTSGFIGHAGRPVKEPSLDRGIVFQEPRLFPLADGRPQYCAWAGEFRAAQGREEQACRISPRTCRLSGFAKAYPHQLSGGMAQRAGIARGLVNCPNALFLDEPFGALDAITKARLQDELQTIWAKERITMVLVTHDVDEAVYLGDRVVVMSPRPGRIRDIVPVDLPRPRDRTSPQLVEIRNRVLESLNATTSTPRPPSSITGPAVETLPVVVAAE